MRSKIGITDVFSGMDLKLVDELGEEWKRHLLDDKPDYKDQILLSLMSDYKSIDNMIKAGYTKEMLENAVSVLKKDGYFVDLKNEIIKKTM